MTSMMNLKMIITKTFGTNANIIYIVTVMLPYRIINIKKQSKDRLCCLKSIITTFKKVVKNFIFVLGIDISDVFNLMCRYTQEEL